MTPTSNRGGKEPTKKPIQRKRTITSAANENTRQLIKAKNVVGGVSASGHAEVRITQQYLEKIYTKLSEDEEKLRKQKSELAQLKSAIQQKYSDLKRLTHAIPNLSGNPFLFMQPFGFGDASRFFGREGIVLELIENLNGNHTTFLDGSGKTSALQAGVVPALLKKGHLPLMVSVSIESLATSIKKQLLPNIEAMDFLKTMSLAEFIRRATDELGKRQQIYLLVDQFEALFDQPGTARDAFKAEWDLCVSGIAPDAHWLFSVPTGSTYLLNMFKEKVAINPNLVTIPPLERGQARKAIDGQAKLRDIRVDPAVAEAILDRLGKPGVDPAQLQLVCYMLAGGKGPLVKHWTMQHYTDLGEADGILRGYLDRTINELDPVERDPAWRLLATLIDPSQGVASEAELLQKMKRFDISHDIARRVLEDLQDSHLVEYATAYRLSSDSLRPSIQEWLDKRAALEQAEEEFSRQLQNIGGSALRGLIGGAVGFALAYWALPYVERVPVSEISLFFQWYFFNLILRALVGAVAGFLMILATDLTLASWRGEKKWLRLPAGMLAGAISFALALVLHITLHYAGDQLLLALGKASVEGAIWGAVAGAGAVWTLTSTQWTGLKLLAVSGLSGLALTLSDQFLSGLDVGAPFYIVFVAGMVMPLFLIGSALLGKAPDAKG